MAALTTHLSRPETHARLPVHPSCPICQGERVVGSLACRPPVSHRTRAGIAVAVLAVSTVGPVAVALASEPPRTLDGSADVNDPAGGGQSQFAPDDRVLSVDFDPTDGAPDLPDDGEVAVPVDEPTDPPALDTDRAPVTNVGSDAPLTVQPQPAAPDAPTVQPPSNAPPPVSEPSSASPLPPPSVPITAGAHTASASSARNLIMSHETQPRAVAPKTRNATPTPASPTLTQRPPSVASATATPSASHANPGESAHTVHAGESLWSIASDHLGAGATPAQIGRMVHRLWQLNSDRIGTGDPDLLMVGTRLRLR